MVLGSQAPSPNTSSAYLSSAACTRRRSFHESLHTKGPHRASPRHTHPPNPGSLDETYRTAACPRSRSLIQCESFLQPLSSEYGTYKTVKTKFWTWLSNESPEKLLKYSLVARKRNHIVCARSTRWSEGCGREEKLVRAGVARGALALSLSRLRPGDPRHGCEGQPLPLSDQNRASHKAHLK